MKQLTDADLDAFASLDRLRALAAYDLAHPDLIEELDAIAAHTAEQICQPIALTNLVLDTATLVKGSYGLDEYGGAPGAPIEWSLCVRAVRPGGDCVIPDLTLDPEEHDNPMIAMGLRSYAGTPLRTLDGHVIGAHCVLGTEAHDFTASELAVLRTAADEVVTTLERYGRD
ncbi:GAF domain-containing protein [Cryptosporangium minutisporangium]|uniref:GAF domain-containing protein n=1 Tax=Cryptosporangium minutisporangium TaxID=113569 RepID=A0ABP6STP5_9ACTN